MVAQREVTDAPLIADDGRYAVIRMRSQDRDRLEKHLFQRYPKREWGTFFQFGYRRTSWGIALTYVQPILPEPGDLDRRSELTVFKDQYTLRAMRVAERRQLAVGTAHSHPSGFRVRPSWLDDDMDAYFSREIAMYGAGMPYLSLIFQRDDRGNFTFSGRVHDKGQWLAVKTLYTAGDDLKAEEAQGWFSGRVIGMTPGNSESTTARLDELIGMQRADRLRRSAVGVIGCSGTGSPAIEVLARAGVGTFVLVDPQRISPSNLERMHGAYDSDITQPLLPYKVEILRRHILAINPKANVTIFVGNLLHDNVLDELLRCDVLLGCTDSSHGRVALSDIAKHFLLPSIDVGVDMSGADGQITNQLADFTTYSPDSPCVFCYGLINSTHLAIELMTDNERAIRIKAAQDAGLRGDNPDHYWSGPRQIHTVGYLTGAIGSLAAGYVEGWLTGAFRMPYDAFQIDVGRPGFGFTPTTARSHDCECKTHLGWSDQARMFRNVARPQHWPARALLLRGGT
jgi:molybdopterin/thiamine biosynthesis adenylyltransferase